MDTALFTAAISKSAIPAGAHVVTFNSLRREDTVALIEAHHGQVFEHSGRSWIVVVLDLDSALALYHALRQVGCPARAWMVALKLRNEENYSLYKQLKALGVPLDSHESDLYAKVTPASKALIADYEFKSNVTTFKSNIDGEFWFDIPFAFEPYWERAQAISKAYNAANARQKAPVE